MLLVTWKQACGRLTVAYDGIQGGPRKEEIPFVHSHKSPFLCGNPALARVSVKNRPKGSALRAFMILHGGEDRSSVCSQKGECRKRSVYVLPHAFTRTNCTGSLSLSGAELSPLIFSQLKNDLRHDAVKQ